MSTKIVSAVLNLTSNKGEGIKSPQQPRSNVASGYLQNNAQIDSEVSQSMSYSFSGTG
jgi:hypothetical protein